MCDFPPAGVITTHETHKSWIIFKDNTTHIGATNTITKVSETSDTSLDNIHLLLDPHLRPATPDFTDPKSVELFEEHKQLAQEYLKIQTELAYHSQHKKRLQEAQSMEQQQLRQRVQRLQSEKESLILLKESLLKQNELLNASARRHPDSWVIVNRHESDI